MEKPHRRVKSAAARHERGASNYIRCVGRLKTPERSGENAEAENVVFECKPGKHSRIFSLVSRCHSRVFSFRVFSAAYLLHYTICGKIEIDRCLVLGYARSVCTPYLTILSIGSQPVDDSVINASAAGCR